MDSFSAHVRFAILLTLLASHSVQACTNLYYTDLEGHSHYNSHERFKLFPEHKYERNEYTPNWQILHDRLEKQLQDHDDFKKRSDLAVALMHLGKADEAVEILVKLDANHPDEYEIAGNLGTAYELAGDLDKAIHWIGVGMERNPDSHDGTEWLHVRILEVKKELEIDPDWLQTHSVLGLDFGTNDAPEMPTDFGEGLDAEEIIRAIDHQLYERLQFVDAPDPIVADLLFTFGNLVALNGYLEPAINAYRLAIEFEPQRDLELIRSRLTHFKELVKANPQSGTNVNEELNAAIDKAFNFLKFCIIGFSIAILVAILWWVRRQRANRKLE